MIEGSCRIQLDAAGFVLAGGQSKRMGQDKTLVQVGGKPLIERALSILKGAGLSAAIAGARSNLSAYGAVVPDDGQGPLSGVCAALRATEAEFSVIVPVDMPLLPSSLVRVMLDRAAVTDARVTVVEANGFAQTFPAVIHRSALEPLASELAAGRRRCFAAFESAAQSFGQRLESVPVEVLAQAGQVAHPLGIAPAFWFLNLNRTENLPQVEEMLSPCLQVS